MTIQQKISKAKIQLVTTPGHAFFCTLLMGIQTVIDPTVQTAATDGESIKLNPDYVEKLTIDQLKGLLCSAILKIANLHPLRRNGRDKDNWSQASEFAVNPLVKTSKLVLPKESLISDQYSNLAAEQIFSLLPGKKPKEEPDNAPDPNGNQTGPGQDNNGAVEVQDSPAKTEVERQQKEGDMKMKVAQAAMIAKKAGTMPGYLEEMITEILEPVINWKEVLARFITDISYSDYSFKLPNPRFIPSGFYLPTLRTEEPGRLAFIVDTSGSMDEELFKQIAGELQEVCNDIKTTVTVLYVDTKVQGVQEIEPDEQITFNAKGRGGTDFAPGFEYLYEQGIDPRAIIYLTDGECDDYPETEPDAPVLWITYNNKHFNPPFGEVLHVNS
jgi:predicted metal-dependent peptidase